MLSNEESRNLIDELRVLNRFDTDSGSIVTFDGLEGMPLKKCLVEINPVQSGSGDPSPSNVRPISGWAGCEISAGNNLLSNLNAIQWTTGYIINASGQISAQSGFRYSSLIPVYEGTFTYVYNSVSTTNRNTRIHAYDASGAWLQQLNYQSSNGATGELEFDIEVPSTAKYIRISTGIDSYSVPVSLSSADNVASKAYSIAFPGLGKNKVPNILSQGSATWVGVTYTVNDDGGITLNGTTSSTSSLTFCDAAADLASKLENGTYILSGCPSGGSSSSYRLIASINDGESYVTDTGSGAQFTIDNSVAKIIVYIRANSGTTFDNLTFYPMIRLSSVSDATYEPYNNTVYGGALDVTTGLLTANWDIIDLSTLTWGGLPAAGMYSCSFPQWKVQDSSETKINGMAEKYFVSNINSDAKEHLLLHSETNIIIGSQGGSPSGMFCYETTEPTTYQLTPQQITTLLGQNNIWADTGDVEIEYGEYLSALKAYIDARIEALSS